MEVAFLCAAVVVQFEFLFLWAVARRYWRRPAFARPQVLCFYSPGLDVQFSTCVADVDAGEHLVFGVVK